MDFNNIIGFMDQQLKALKELEELLAYDESQSQDHTIKPENIEALKDYTATMKQAAKTAKALAEHYKKAGNTKPVENVKEESVDAVVTEESKKAEKPKRNRTKPETPKEEPDNKPADAETLKEEPVKEPAAEETKPEDDEFDFLN